MSEERITGSEVSEWLKSNDKKAAWLAETMRVTPATVSRWLNEKNPISGSDEAILKLLVRGEMPFDIVHEKTLHGVLDFTEDQWRVITILANRMSTTPGKWIADKIRWMLAGDATAREETAAIQAQRHEQTARFSVVEEDCKVADERSHEGK